MMTAVHTFPLCFREIREATDEIKILYLSILTFYMEDRKFRSKFNGSKHLQNVNQGGHQSRSGRGDEEKISPASDGNRALEPPIVQAVA
jgi:hypothetical protein